MKWSVSSVVSKIEPNSFSQQKKYTLILIFENKSQKVDVDFKCNLNYDFFLLEFQFQIERWTH